MHSSYSIDGGPATDFIPASTVVKPAYRQKFFASDTLTNGEHTLVITNLGKELWFDYVLVTLPSSTTSTTPSGTSEPIQAPASTSSATQDSPSPSPPATSRSTNSLPDNQSPAASQPISSTSAPKSSADTSTTNTALLTSTTAGTSADPTASSSSGISGTTRPQSSDRLSATGGLSSATAGSGRSTLTTGAIAGVAVGGIAVLAVVLMLVWVGCKRRRGKQGRNRDDVIPFGELTHVTYPSRGAHLSHYE